ncbi:MAG TPA: DUF6338 family protein [Longimicrobium sp.]|nr:DUF6338 family protein [Longimicrobium sp.]
MLLFFPGVLCALLVDALTVHRERTPAQFLTNAFALGMGSYLSLALVRDAVAGIARWFRLRPPLDVTSFDALVNDRVKIAWGEITLAATVGMVLSCIGAAAMNRKLVARAANALGITRRTGDFDVWGFLFNSRWGNVVTVRDVAQDTVYSGAVEAFSESVQNAELLLRNVKVFRNSTTAKLYDADRVYIARDTTSLVIETTKAEED